MANEAQIYYPNRPSSSGSSGGGGRRAPARSRVQRRVRRTSQPQTMEQQLWGGDPGIGSMQPGQVVSVERHGQQQQQQRNQELIEGLTSQFQEAQQQANEANRERYQNLLDTIAGLQERVLGEGGTYAEAMELMQGTGASARRRVARQRTKQYGRAEQDLISRGLGNTTVRESVRRGIGRQAEQQMQQIDEQVAQRLAGLLRERASMETQIGRLRTQAIQSRQDQGPNTGQYLQLLQQLASA